MLQCISPPKSKEILQERIRIPLPDQLQLSVIVDNFSLLEALLASERKNELIHLRDENGEAILHYISRNQQQQLQSYMLIVKTFSPMEIKVLLDVKSHDNETALHVALASESFELARAFLAFGADPWQFNYYAETAFYLACYAGQVELVRLILHRSVSPLLVSARNKDGRNALEIAQIKQHESVLQEIQLHLRSFQ